MSTWNLQLVRIYEKGMNAFECGKRREDCPYPWARSGFNRIRRDYWLKGFEEAVMIASDQRLFDAARKNSANPLTPASRPGKAC